MTDAPSKIREGSLDAPTRHKLDWKNPDFYNEELLNIELERIFDICHGCRRCVSLCHSFPTLFDLVDESDTMEVDGVKKADYWNVVDQCYLCDLCYLTKCPYVPPHEWNLDFPHTMLRAKAVKFKKGETSTRDKILTSTDAVGSLAGIPVVSTVINKVNKNTAARKVLENVLGVHADAILPEYHSNNARKRLASHESDSQVIATESTTGQVSIFATCYGNRNSPQIIEDMVSIFEHNGIKTDLLSKEVCCGMPKLELGDLESVEKAKDINIPVMLEKINQGYDIIAPIPSCVLMFKQELPLMFPDDADVKKVQQHIYDPFEYLMLRHKDGKLKTDFKQSLGKVSYHAACHLRVQNIGLKTRDLLKMIPDTEVSTIERCSGHDGTYAVKKEFHEISKKICRPVVNQIKKFEPDYYASDCPMAGEQIQNTAKSEQPAMHPLSLIRKAYDI